MFLSYFYSPATARCAAEFQERGLRTRISVMARLCARCRGLSTQVVPAQTLVYKLRSSLAHRSHTIQPSLWQILEEQLLSTRYKCMSASSSLQHASKSWKIPVKSTSFPMVDFRWFLHLSGIDHHTTCPFVDSPY